MKNLGLWQFAGFTFAVVLGTVLHFLYAWTGAIGFAPISAVNESTWEHMKILFFPLLFFACIQRRFFGAECAGFWWIKTAGIITGVLSIPILFYTWTGAFGKTPDWLNILFFFLSAGGAYFLEFFLFRKAQAVSLEWVAKLLLLAIVALFFVFTFFPPHLPLFENPLTNSYGISR